MSKEFIFFGVVGIISNASMFLLYIALVDCKLNSKIAITVAYILNILISFYFNKRITFSSNDESMKRLKRFLLMYLNVYILNIFMLHLFADILLIPPEIVQGILLLVFIPFVFVLQRCWVFSKVE